MIEYKKGDIFDSLAEVYVHPTTIFGNPDGISVDFKEEFPNMFKEYKLLSNKGEIKFGYIHYHEVTEEENPDYEGLIILTFPIKSSWNNNPKLEYLENSLIKIIEIIKEDEYKTVAIPFINSLNREEVEKLYQKYFEMLPEVKFEVFK